LLQRVERLFFFLPSEVTMSATHTLRACWLPMTVLLLVACDDGSAPPASPAVSQPALAQPAKQDEPTKTAAVAPAAKPHPDPAVAALDARIGPQLAHVRRQGDRPSPTDLEILAQLYLERAGLSGDYDDYGKAEEALDLAVRKSTPGAGPLLARAHFRYKVHQLPRARQDLDAADKWVIKRAIDVQTIASLRADIAFHSGQYAVARKGYLKDLDRNKSPGQAVSLAQLEWKTGHFARAQALFAKARSWAQAGGAELRAWVALCEGLMEMDRGRDLVALAHFERGLGERPGFWVLQEHRAEVLAEIGRQAEALPIYLDLVQRTGDPEFMDAAAQIYEKTGDQVSAQRWATEARAGYDKRLARFPEATAGHALDFFLRRDPKAAIPVARLNVAARPGGEAQVLLARAYLANKQLDDAKATIEAVLATEWNTAELHAVAAEIFEATRDRRAAGARRKALALNPRVFGSAPSRADAAKGRQGGAADETALVRGQK
jgi:tetratricopeptide (TPR) repeat protein